MMTPDAPRSGGLPLPEPTAEELASHEELEAVFRFAPVAVGLVDRELRFVWVNERLASMNGRSAAEHIGCSMEEVVPSRVRPQALAIAREVLETGREVLDATVRAAPSGGRAWLVSARPHLREGRVAGLVAVVHEITGLERARQETQERLAELETVTAHAPVALAHLDTELRYVWVSPLLARLNGRSPEAHVGRHVTEVVPDFADRLLPVLHRVLKTGQLVQDLPFEGRPPGDPRRGYWLAHFQPLTGADGKVAGIVAAIEDATRLKRVERALRAQARHLLRAQSIAGVGSWEWNVLEDRVWWSEQLYRIFGKDRRSFRPRFEDLFELVHPGDRSRVRAQLERILEQGGSSTVVCRAFREDGSLVQIRATAELERTPDGRPLRLLGTAEDLSGRGDGQRSR
jgi:PAS domain S-box-containing protein